MPLPSGLTTILVTDTYLDLSGKPLAGSVTFTPTSQLSDSAGNVVFPLLPVTATVSQATGTFSVRLPCTDNTALSPSGWAYLCEIGVPGVYAETFTALFPSTLGASVQLRTVAPMVPPGPPIATAVTSVNGQIGAVELTAFAVGADASGAAAAETARAEAAEALLVPLSDLPLALTNGGTGQVSQPAALTALAGTQSAGKYLRSDGTNTALANVVAGDVPTLNQNTTGTAAGLSATLAIGSGGTGSPTRNFAGLLTPTATKTGAYTAAAGDMVIADISGGGFTVTLPATPAAFTVVGVKVIATPASGINTLTVQRGGSDHIDTSSTTSVSLSQLNQSKIFQYVSGIWTTWTGDLSLAQLDSRYTAWANVKNYGAKGDGTTDDTAAIQAACNAAKAADGAVYFPPTSNWYHTTAPISISGGNSLTLIGDGYRSVIKSSGNYDIFDFSSMGALTVTSIRLDTEVTFRTDAGCGTVLSSTTVTDTHCVSGDVGLSVSGPGIPATATISSVTPGTSFVMSAAATATATVSLTVGAGNGFNLTSCSNMYFLWVMTADVWNGLSTTGSDTITMFGSFFHGYNAGLYTQNAIHASASQMGGGTYGIVLDSTSGSCSFMSCAFFGPVSLVTWNSLSRTNPNKGLTFFNSGSNWEAGNGAPPEGNGGIDLNYCAGNVILDQCYNAGSGLRFGSNVTTFDTLHIVGGEYGGSGSSQADGIIMSKGSHITIHGAKLGGTANTSSDIISIASGVDSVVISGNHFIGTCNYAVNCAATGTGTGEIIVRDNDFTGITSSPNLSAGTYINVPSGSIASYSIGGNTSGLVTTKATRVATLTAVSNVYTPSRDTMDEALITSPAAAFTIAAPTGTALDGDKLIIRIRSGSSAFTPTWTTTSGGYEGSPGLALPSSVTASAVDYFGFKYNITSGKWLLLAYMPGFS